MKNYNLIRISFAILCIAISTKFTAQNKILVDNNVISPTSQKNLQQAIDDAAAGSTIYVQPSPYSYGPLQISKEIHIVGAGSSDRYNQTIIDYINLDNGASNSSFSGLNVDRIEQPGSSIENITIKECRMEYIRLGNFANFTGVTNAKNYILEGNQINTITTGWDVENIIIKNNILYQLIFTESNNFYVSQNIFKMGSSIRVTNNRLDVTNSIFIGNTDISGGSSAALEGQVDLYNCLTYDYGSANNFVFDDNFYDKYTSKFNGMLKNTDPKFLHVNKDPNQSYDEVNRSIANSLYLNFYKDDLHLATDSPAKAAGVYGYDIGVYNNFDFRNFGNPKAIPVIKSVASPSSIPSGSSLDVTISAKAQ